MNRLLYCVAGDSFENDPFILMIKHHEDNRCIQNIYNAVKEYAFPDNLHAAYDAIIKLIDKMGTCTTPVSHAWHAAGMYFLESKRDVGHALVIFLRVYNKITELQLSSGRIDKKLPLLGASECFQRLGFTVHAKRYKMLAICEEAITNRGNIEKLNEGAYFYPTMQHDLAEMRSHAKKLFELSESEPSIAMWPEAILHRLNNDDWLTEFPSPREVSAHFLNQYYVKHLLAQFGKSDGNALEWLAHYLMWSMPGCRVTRRKQSHSTDYDLVCSMEGFDLDFRSEFGRYFICECKDWKQPADFGTLAKLCRVLDSVKARFGILFSKNGISGEGKAKNAEREQIKVFQDRGTVIVVITEDDVKEIVNGGNFINLLRRKYDEVRLDLRT